MKSYRDLEVYQLSYNLALKIHDLSMKLPKYELYEMGSQIRRASKSINYNIVEGYGRKKYKQDFIRFLIIAHSSCDETQNQLKMINDIHFKGKPETELQEKYEELGKKLYAFIQYVEKNWK